MKKISFFLCAALAAAFLASCGKTGVQEAPEALPERYSLVDENRITSYKDQHQSGMCWAFSAAAAAESSLITDGFEDPSVDLSEGHIVYTVYPFEEERPEDSTEDGIFISGEKKKNLMIPCYLGGMSSIAAMKFSLGEGMIYEEEAPFGTDAGELQKSVNNYFSLEEEGKIQKETGDYLLTKLLIYEDEEAIKRGIMETGAVCTGINADQRGFSRDKNGEACYFLTPADPKTELSILDRPNTNHVVTIAGWDDAYSKNNFDQKPSRDGAWLVKDSISSRLNYRESGYYWMSYDEMHAGDMGMKFAKKADYGEILSYDSIGPADGLKAEGEETVIANVFQADSDGTLKGIGIFALNPGQKITLSVYQNPEDDKPDSGEKLFEREVVIAHPGYELIETDQAITIAAGDVFSITAAYANEEGKEFAAPVEGDSSVMKANAQACLYLVSGEGESYAKNGGTWYDLSLPETAAVFHKTGMLNNAPIKAVMG